MLRLRESEDRAVVLDHRRVERQLPSRRLHLRLVAARQVRADDLPALAPVVGPEDVLPRDVEHVRVVRREDYGVRPLEPVLVVLHARAPLVLRPDRDDARLADAVVVPEQRVAAARRAADCPGEDDVRVLGVDGDVPALRAPHRVAVGPRNRPRVRAARHADRAVVLLGGVDPVGKLVVGGEVVELRRELVVDRRPGLAAVERHARPAVVALDHPLRVARVDPQLVVVAVRRGYPHEGLAPVRRLPHVQVQHVAGVRVLRVGVYVGVVPRPLQQVAVVVDVLPRIAAVVRPVQPPLLGLDDRPDPPRLGGRGSDADPPLGAFRQSLVAGDVGPGVAPVRRLVETAVRPAARELEGLPQRLPHGRVHDAGVRRVQRQVDCAGLVALVQHLLPRVAAVLRPEHPALLVGTECVAEGGHVHEIGVRGMDSDPRDVPRVLQAHVLPRLPSVGGPVHAVAVGHVAADAGLAGTGVDHVGVGLANGQRAHRRGVEIVVADGLPVGAAVGRLPDAAPDGAEVEDHWVAGVARGGHDTAAPRWTDAPPPQGLHQAGIDAARHSHLAPRVSTRVIWRRPSSHKSGPHATGPHPR